MRRVLSESHKHRPHLKQVLLNSCWEMINQELINGAADVDSSWSFICRVDTLNIVSVNPVTYACCKLFLSQIALKMLSALMFFLPGSKQTIYLTALSKLAISCVVK